MTNRTQHLFVFVLFFYPFRTQYQLIFKPSQVAFIVVSTTGETVRSEITTLLKDHGATYKTIKRYKEFT